MATRRISRGTPAMLTVDEQRAFVTSVNKDPALRRDIETLLDIKWAPLKFGQKLLAIGQYMETGRALTAMVGASRARKDVANAAAELRGEIAAVDRLSLVEEENRLLREQTQQLNEQIAQLRRQLTARQAKAAIISKRAESAAAVHSND